MKIVDIKRVAVIGAGTMGKGIAYVFAQNGFEVKLVDRSKETLANAFIDISAHMDRQVQKGKMGVAEKKSNLAHIDLQTSIKESIKTSQLIVEVISENFESKKVLLKLMDEETPKNVIFATNTSSISITKLAACTNRPQNVVGMHFMNPAPVMPLIEVIRGLQTSDETIESIVDLGKKMGKTPVEVKDYPGFIANRILMPMINEAIISLHQGVAGVKEIDLIMKLGASHQMGPLLLADFIGLDICLSILNVMYDGWGTSKYAPCPLLVNMVAAGYLGKKTGEGFYNYSTGSKDPVVSNKFGS